jgi:biopolymer transport protein TolR
MGMSAGSGTGVQSTPNVTPMIDVMLVLLIIFMVMVPQMLAGFNADPPVGVNIRDHPPDEALDQVLGIDKAGRYYLQKKPIEYDAIGPTLLAVYSSGRDDFVMYLKADRDLDYEKVLDAMELASKNKVRTVALVADQKSGTVSSIPGDVAAQAASGSKPPGGN